jgi:LysM repeat protein
MRKRFSLASTLFLALSLRAIPAAASSQADLEQEYSQVRKIALKDPKVQEAFAKANQRLDEKILRIDPALKAVVERHAHTVAPPAAEASAPKAEPHPAALSAPVAAHEAVQGREHIVIKGDTLSSIAAHYKVKVAALEKLNHITDDRKLRVGQKLVIPATGSIETRPAAETQESPPPPRDNGAAGGVGGMWDRLKSSL